MKLESSVSASLETIREELSRTKLSTSTLNLVVWIDDAGRRAWIIERTELVGEKHPSFALILDRTGCCPGEAVVITSDRDVLSHFTVQGERVVVDVSEAAPETVAELVSTFCPSGVPTVVWWTGSNVADRPHFEALLPYVTTLVVDSSGSATDERTLCSIVRFHAQHPEIAVRDLAWLRLHPWQEMIAHLFDDPALLEELFDITALHVASGSISEALYLAGWLASRLGWNATGPGSFTDRNGKTIAFHYEAAGDIRRIQRICLDSTTTWYHAQLVDGSPEVVRVWSEGKHARLPALFTLHHVDNASLIERAVLEGRSDELFETALRSAATLLP